MRFANQATKDDQIVQAIQAREAEIVNYEVNENNYESILRTYKYLLEEWPDKIKQYKGQPNTQVAMKVDDETFDLFNQYTHRDQIKMLLKTTKAEKAKSERVLIALEASISEERIEAALVRLNA